jgi:site-specific recombinase XerD
MKITKEIALEKIYHRDKYIMCIYYEYDFTIKQKLKEINAKYTKTHQSYYFDYSTENFNFLHEHFQNVKIINPKNKQNINHLKIEEKPNIELGIQYLGIIGRYWTFKIKYIQKYLEQLKKSKNVFWNTKHKCFFAFRNQATKEIVESILNNHSFLEDNFYDPTKLEKIDKPILFTTHPEDQNWIEIYTPAHTKLQWQIKKMTYCRESKTKNCFLLPASTSVFENLNHILDNYNILIKNLIPKEYLSEKKLPNKKKWEILNNKENIFEKIPNEAKPYIIKLSNIIMAFNYSNATLRNYCFNFLNFLKDHNYKDPKEITEQEIIQYLALKNSNGLSASAMHTQVNAIKFYYTNVEKNNMELKIPRPKNEKKLPAILTMEECLKIFKVTENKKHQLMLLIGYGAGLRVSEIASLEWKDILFQEHKIHLKNAKGQKDRMVMLPISIIQSLKQYKNNEKSSKYVFEGQYAGEHISTKTIQQVMKNALIKSEINKKAAVHTLRHTFATHLLESGVDISYIQKFLGHSNIKTTLIYTHLTNEAVAKIESPLDKIVRNEINKNK